MRGNEGSPSLVKKLSFYFYSHQLKLKKKSLLLNDISPYKERKKSLLLNLI